MTLSPLEPLTPWAGLTECLIAGIAVGLLDSALGLLAVVRDWATRRANRAAGFAVARPPRRVLPAGPATTARRGPWQRWRTPTRLRHLPPGARRRPGAPAQTEQAA